MQSELRLLAVSHSARLQTGTHFNIFSSKSQHPIFAAAFSGSTSQNFKKPCLIPKFTFSQARKYRGNPKNI